MRKAASGWRRPGTWTIWRAFLSRAPATAPGEYFYVDGFWSNYLYQKNLGSQYSIPVILYLEDEYWGIYCIRPSKDETFVADQFGVDADAVTIIATGGTTPNRGLRPGRPGGGPAHRRSLLAVAQRNFRCAGFHRLPDPPHLFQQLGRRAHGGQHHSVEGGCRFLGPLYRRKVAVPLQRFRPDDELRVHGFHRRSAE